MEENKKEKKNKMPMYLIAIAIVLMVLGVMDIKVNAAENQYLELYYEFGLREDTSQIYDGWLYSDWDGVQRTFVFDNNYTYALLRSDYIQSNVVVGYKYDIYCGTIGGSYSVVNLSTTNSVSSIPVKTYYKNSDDVPNGNYTNVPIKSSSWNTVLYPDLLPYTTYSYTYISHNTNLPIFTDTQGLADYYATGDLSGQYKPPIDYDSLEIDNDMLVVEDLKRNIISNNKTNGIGLDGSITSEIYDYVTWTNTSSQYQLQLQTVPVVQYYKIMLKNTFVKEFIGEWKTQEIFEEVTNSYTKGTDLLSLANSDTEAWQFYSECGDKYSTGAFEERFLYFGYRLRYIDLENMKAGPWVVIMPSNTKDSYNGYIGYSDDTTEDIGNSDGVHNEYSNMEDIEDAKEDIKTENEFKDKYDIIDGDADVGEITNWLNSVIGFIKSSPSVIGSVLSFLPQPILYGLYITIFLGVFATAVGIVKALI